MRLVKIGKFKAVLSILMTLMMLMSSLAVTPFAAVAADLTPVLTAGNVSDVAGATIQVPVTLNSTGQVAGVQFDLSYDQNILTYVSTSRGVLTTNSADPFSVSANKLPNGDIRVLIYNGGGVNIPSGNDTIALLGFQVVSGVQAGQTSTLGLSGVIFADASGNPLTSTVNNGQFSVPQPATVAVTGVSLNKSTDTITVGNTDRLTATVAPSDATDQSVTWASDNSAVATVDNTGLVTAVTTGTAIITVTTVDGSKTATCAMTVQPSVETYSITKATVPDLIWTVTTDKTVAAVGETVTVTVADTTPTSWATGLIVTGVSRTAYNFTTVTAATGNANNLNGAGVYSFVMPAEPVTVGFTEDYTPLNVYVQVGSGAETLVHSYTRAEMEALAASNTSPVYYTMYDNMPATFMGKAVRYVSIQQLVDSAKGYNSAVRYNDSNCIMTGASIDGWTTNLTWDYLMGTTRQYYASLGDQYLATENRTGMNREVPAVLAITGWAGRGINVVSVDNKPYDTLNAYRLFYGQSAFEYGDGTITGSTKTVGGVSRCTANNSAKYVNKLVFKVSETTPATYTVTADSAITGGSIAMSPTSGAAGDTVTVTVTPNGGKQLVADSLKYTADGGSAYTAISATNGVYSFTLPAANTVVTAQFENIPVAVTNVTLNKNTGSIIAGATDQLTATVAPANATNQSVTWASDNTAVATVDNTGLVTAVAAGTANITVTTADGSKTATCVVTVAPANPTNPGTSLSYKSATIDTTNKIVTLTFSDLVLNNTTSLDELKKGITFADDGVNFKALSASDTIELKDKTLIITLNTAIHGSANKIMIKENTLKDSEDKALQTPVTVGPIKAFDECFIATAAFGSKNQTDVVLLRHFRDQFLLTNPMGQLFVQTYYHYSPPIAQFIAGNVILKFVTRVALLPFVAVVYMLFHPVLLVSILAVIALLLMQRRRRKVVLGAK